MLDLARGDLGRPSGIVSQEPQPIDLLPKGCVGDCHVNCGSLKENVSSCQLKRPHAAKCTLNRHLSFPPSKAAICPPSFRNAKVTVRRDPPPSSPIL